MVKRRSKKQPKFTIRDVDVNEFNRLQNNAKAMIRSRKKKYGVDISGEIDLKTSITEFKTRKGFNAWKEAMSKLRYRADLQIKKVGDTVASQKQINQSQREVNVMKRKLQKVDGEYQNKYKVRFNEKQLFELALQTNVARDMEIARQKQLESIPRFNKKGQQIKDVRKDKTGGTVIVRDKFDPTILDNNQRVKIREYNLKQVSDPERYSRREQQLKMNFERTIREQLDEDGQKILDYIATMSDAEFNNFYFMFMDSSLNFEYIYKNNHDFDDNQTAGEANDNIANAILTDISRYDKNREKYKMLMKY